MSSEAHTQEGLAASTHRLWVVGVDGSSCARDALDWAINHVADRGDALHVVTAWQTPLNGSPGLAAPMAVPIDDSTLADAAATTAEEEAKHAAESSPVPVHAVVAHGSASPALLEAGKEAELLVVGSRGRGGFGRLLLGSTSTQCATHATMPIAVIPHDNTITATTGIVVAIDGSPNSLSALEWVLGFARPGTTITVIWVWDATPLAVGADEFFFPDASATAETRFHHLIDEVVQSRPDNDITIERSFVHGRPRSTIADACAGADMLVLGARGHGAVGSALLGSVSTWLLHHVEIPVVVVPHPVDESDGNDPADD